MDDEEKEVEHEDEEDDDDEEEDDDEDDMPNEEGENVECSPSRDETVIHWRCDGVVGGE